MPLPTDDVSPGQAPHRRRGAWARFENGPLLSIATLLLVASTGVMLLEGFSRALFDRSFFWAEESVRYLMIWAFFLALGAAGRRGYHIRTDMLPASVGVAARRAMNVAAMLAGVAFCGLLVWASWPQLHRYYTMGVVSESSLNLPEWAVFAVMPLGAALWLVYYLGGLLRAARNEDPFIPDPEDGSRLI